MEVTHLFVLALFWLNVVGIIGSKTGEEYWKSTWPNTPIPKALTDLLLPNSKSSVPIRGQEEKQYWTVFFEHDLYPGKNINLGTHKHSHIQPLQSFGSRKWLQKTTQPFGINTWWDRKASQENKNEIYQSIPIETFGILVWTDKSKLKETKNKIQTSMAKTWSKKETHVLHDYCENPSAIGEDKYCAPTLESMMDFAISKLGKNIKVMSSSFGQSQDQYVVVEVKKIGDNVVMCHRINFEKVAFYCHQVNATTTYMVPLMASDGTKSEALTICHHDTRGMDPKTLYDALKVKPGTVPICHFIGNKAVAWVPNDDVTKLDSHPCVI